VAGRFGEEPADGPSNLVKIAYKIGEVARLAGVRPSVLRHWESQFGGLRPKRTSSGQRTYSRQDVRRVLEIQRLLKARGYTTKGARQALREQGLEPRDPADPLVQQNRRLRAALLELRDEVRGLLARLEGRERA
jgi:DNA-binding transcriptional MerR regulator